MRRYLLTWLDLWSTLEAEHDAGDHSIAEGRVQAFEIAREEQPLLFSRGAYGQFEQLSL